MKVFNKVRGTMATVPNIEVNVDTVYIRSNIVAINETDFTGWEYDEIQYDIKEYTENMATQTQNLQTSLLATQDAINSILGV